LNTDVILLSVFFVVKTIEAKKSMRISGWLLGFIGFGVLFVATGICSFATFSITRQTVIDLQETGILLDDPLAMVRCVTTAQCQTADIQPTPIAQTADTVAMTPLFTVVPTQVASVAEPTNTPADMSDTSAAEATVQAALAVTQATSTPVPTMDPAGDLPRITDPRQIRILLLGIDQRSAAGETGPFRTDTMILMNIDPVRKTVGVLSLPRDLWVNIPNFEPGRINVANFLGDANAYPGGGGPALAMETVSSNFGVRVDKYLLVNFDVFTTIVD
ncbi:MAG: hypothetical protein CUN57_00395, partial [Phototrophicales bacterium]